MCVCLCTPVAEHTKSDRVMSDRLACLSITKALDLVVCGNVGGGGGSRSTFVTLTSRYRREEKTQLEFTSGSCVSDLNLLFWFIAKMCIYTRKEEPT